MMALTNTPKVLTDTGTMTGVRRARLTGRDEQELYPMLFTMRLLTRLEDHQQGHSEQAVQPKSLTLLNLIASLSEKNSSP